MVDRNSIVDIQDLDVTWHPLVLKQLAGNCCLGRAFLHVRLDLLVLKQVASSYYQSHVVRHVLLVPPVLKLVANSCYFGRAFLPLED